MKWKLPRNVKMYEGMRSLTFNISVSSQLANGTVRTIEKIYLDPREPEIPINEQYHKLHFSPILLLFQPDNRQEHQFAGLENGLLPIEPSKTSICINTQDKKKVTIYRDQYAIMAVYAFTDYKSQGQTLSPVILDIAAPLMGKLMLHYCDQQAVNKPEFYVILIWIFSHSLETRIYKNLIMKFGAQTKQQYSTNGK